MRRLWILFTALVVLSCIYLIGPVDAHPIDALQEHQRRAQERNDEFLYEDPTVVSGTVSDQEDSAPRDALDVDTPPATREVRLDRLGPAAELVAESPTIPASLEGLKQTLTEVINAPRQSLELLSRWLQGDHARERRLRRFQISRVLPTNFTNLNSTTVARYVQTEPIDEHRTRSRANNTGNRSASAAGTVDIGDPVVEMNCFAGKKVTATRTHYTAAILGDSNRYAQDDQLETTTGTITVDRGTLRSQPAANLLATPAVSALPEGYPKTEPDAAVVYTDDANTQYYSHVFPFTDGCVQTEFWLNQTFLHVPEQLVTLLEIDLTEANQLVAAVKKQPGEAPTLAQTFTHIDGLDTGADSVPARVPETRGRETVSWRSLATRVCHKIVEKYAGANPQPPAHTQTATNQNTPSTSPGHEGEYPLGSDLDVCERLAQCRQRDSLRAQPETLDFCACPYDYAGIYCQTPRELQCFVTEHPFDATITCGAAPPDMGYNRHIDGRGFNNEYDGRLVGFRPCREVPRRDPAIPGNEKYAVTWHVVPRCQFGVMSSLDVNSPTSTPEHLRDIVWQGPPPSVRKTLEDGEYTWDKNYNFDYVVFRPLHDADNATQANRDTADAVPPRFALSVPADANAEERTSKLEAIMLETYVASHDRISDRTYSKRIVLSKQILEAIDLWSAAEASHATTEAEMESTALRLQHDLKTVTVTDALPPGSPAANNDVDPIPRSHHQLQFFPGGRASLQSRIVFEDSIRLPFATPSFVARAAAATAQGITLVPQPLIGTGADDDARPALIITPKSRGTLTAVDVVRYDPGAAKKRPLTSIQKMIIVISCIGFVIIVIMLLRCWFEARERAMFRRAKEEAADRAARLRLRKQAAGEDPDDILSSEVDVGGTTHASQSSNDAASKAQIVTSSESEPVSRKRAVIMPTH